jgi:hypothetical protein
MSLSRSNKQGEKMWGGRKTPHNKIKKGIRITKK